MNTRIGRAVGAMLILSGVTGCASLSDIVYSDLSDYTVTSADLDPDNRANNSCRLGGPYTSQGHSLCNALMHVEIRQAEIVAKVQEISDQPFDLSLLALGFLSAGALAADSHDSVLKGLGILSATALGLRSYAASSARRSAYMAGNAGLSCLSEASVHLLWDDSWFYRLRSHRRLLGETLGVLAEAAQASTDQELKARAENVRLPALESIRLADDAVARYAGMGSKVDARREAILLSMRTMADSSRDDVGGVVNSILAAESVKTARNAEVDSAQEQITETAAEIAPSGMAAAMAVSEVNNIVDAQPDRELSAEAVAGIGATLSEVAAQAAREAPGDDPTSREANAKLIASLATVAKAMQEIAYIAPRYIKTSNAIDACVIG